LGERLLCKQEVAGSIPAGSISQSLCQKLPVGYDSPWLPQQPSRLSSRPEQPRTHGDVLSEVSDGIVALFREYYGRGPTRAKTYYHDDLVVCLLRGGYTRVEETLRDGGRGDVVISQRLAFLDVMRDRFEAVIQNATGREVIGFMSGNQQHPDLLCEIFVLGHTDLVEPHELA
jgi:uncharacterized protein YbcI